MDTITLFLVITSFGLAGTTDGCRTSKIYFDNYNQLIRIYDTEAVDADGIVTKKQTIYFWDESLKKYDEETATWTPVRHNPIEYTVEKLDVGREVAVDWSNEPSPGDIEGTMTFRKRSRRANTSNLMQLDCPATSINTDDFIIKMIPNIEDYNIPALRQVSAVITWKTESGDFPVFWTDYTASSRAVVHGGKLYSRETQHRVSSSIRRSKESIAEVKRRYFREKGRKP